MATAMDCMEEDLNGHVTNYRRPMRPFKVAFAGVYTVGKTSLFRRMFEKGFCLEKPPSSPAKLTYEAVFHKDQIVIPLEIWDTADMEKHESVTLSYYRGSHFALLVYSADDENSLHSLKAIADDVKRHEHMAKLILVRNKTDLPIGEDTIPLEKQKTFIRDMGNKLFRNFETSAKENEGIINLLTEIAKQSLKMFKSRRNEIDDKPKFDFDDNKPPEKEGIKCCT